MTLLIFILCIIYASVIIANPLKTTSYFSTSSSVVSENTQNSSTVIDDSSSNILNEYEIIGHNETRVTTKSMNFFNSSRKFNLEDGEFMVAANIGWYYAYTDHVSIIFTAYAEAYFSVETTFIDAEYCTIYDFPLGVRDELLALYDITTLL